MKTGVPRAEQIERNRGLVLAAARRVFLERGYAGATLDAIAEEAGFSKGVVYSRFGGKADLFLALLEQRIEERAGQNRALADELAGAELVEAALALADHLARTEPEWALLVVEFRAHAARDPELNRRYAEHHARTVERLADVVRLVRPDRAPAAGDRHLAELLLAVGSGLVLERHANADALPADVAGPLLARMVVRET
jgi:AcrR family transcriptional regulator